MVHLLVVSSEERKFVYLFVPCGLGNGGRLGFLDRGGAAGLTSGRVGCATSTPCWVFSYPDQHS